MVYSDLNAILLGEIVRHVSGQTLDAFVTQAIYAPLGLDQQMLFRPPKRLVRGIAPTNLWRGHPIAGVVNDPERREALAASPATPVSSRRPRARPVRAIHVE